MDGSLINRVKKVRTVFSYTVLTSLLLISFSAISRTNSNSLKESYLALSSLSAYFSVDTASGCAHHATNFPVQITDQSVGATNWKYTILRPGFPSDVIYDDVVDPGSIAHVFINNSSFPIEYTIHLEVEAAGIFSEYSRVITVYPSITAEFTSTYIDGNCANPREVRFTNQSSNNTSDTYYWTLGDGANRISTSHDEVFNHSYENLTLNGVDYDITLIAQSDFGCRDTATAQAYVTSRFVPQFEVGHTEGCGPLEVDVTNNSEGDISTYSWSINPNPGGLSFPVNSDDFSIVLPNSSNSPINYTLSLEVTNTDGCSKTSDQVITVYPQVQVTFTPENIVICDSAQVDFESTLGNPALPNITYSWDFDDGASSDQKDPSHDFTNDGDSFVDRNVSLVATSQYECSNDYSTTVRVHPRIKASFSVSDPEICSGEEITFAYERMASIDSYDFDFDTYAPNTWPGDAGANGTFNKEFINQTGSPFPLDITLTTNNTHAACQKDFSIPVTVNPEVTADFTWTGDSPQGCSPLEVEFTNTTTFTGIGTFDGSYLWSFGDGTTSTETDPTHVFINDDPDNTATFTVTLTATSVHGCVHTYQEDITLQPRLSAGFSIEQPDICEPEFVFTPSSPGATEYNWDFDGLIASETIFDGKPFTRTINPTHDDNLTEGEITLTVENAAGCSDVTTRDITIHPFIVPIFTPSVDIGCSDLEVTFTNTSTGGPLEFKWDFDDEQTHTTSSKDDFTHTLVNRNATDRVFEVWLIAKNVNGCKDSTSSDITVHPKVEADFSFTYDSLCTPFRVEIVNSSLNGSNFEWDFGQTGFWEDDTTTVKANSEFEFTLDNPTDNDVGDYTIGVYASTFHALSGLTCDDSKELPFGEVFPRVVANFGMDVTEGCNPLTVVFTNTSTGLGTYEWDYDDETTSNEESPSKIFAHSNTGNSQLYNVGLTSTNVNGCKDYFERVITVYPLVESAFTIDEDDGCTPLIIPINNSKVSSAYVYDWDFGDGQTSALAQPGSINIENTLDPLAIFGPTIVLETSLDLSLYPEGCLESSSRQVTVYPHIYPDFIADFDGCHPHPVDFTNDTETYGGINNATYSWSFGNGAVSNNTHPNQNYYNSSQTKDTTFKVLLRAYSIHGCTDTISHNVTVFPKPRSRMNILSGTYACSPYEVEIENTSLGKGFGSTLSFDYYFGDGDSELNITSTDNIFHLYPSNLSEEVEPYEIILDITTSDGCTHTSSQTINIYPEVIADFDFDPGDADCNPFLVTMENESNANAIYYNWNFGDGTTSNLFEPNHLFVNNSTEEMEFEVSLTSISEFDCDSTFSRFVTVYPAPVANFAPDQSLRVFPDATFEFRNQSSPAADEWEYTWTFGDGYGSDFKQPLPHEYETWGPSEEDFRYLITLNIENEHCSDSIARYITLRPAQPEPEFSTDLKADCAPLVVYFVNNSQYGDSYLWDFGDGSTSADFEPVHTFEVPGYYNVKLTVTGDGGESEYFDVFQVFENPTADFLVKPPRVMLPEARVHVHNLSEGASTFLWDMGDGTVLNGKDIVHSYTEIGEYRISLTAFTDKGCVDSTSKFPAVWVTGAGHIRFPNAFSPSKLGPTGGFYDEVDFSNEVFHPVHNGVVEYRLMIFNRWGEQVFQSNDIRQGWDGYRNGKLLPQDVYIWRAVGRFADGKMFDKRGNVSLLR